jgi:hypothetical protein
MATTVSTLVGILVTARVQRISLRDPLLLVVAGLWLTMLAALGTVVWLAPTDLANTLSSLLGNGILLLVLSAFFIAAWRGGVDSYDTFVEGAKEGFTLAVRLIPYLVAMLAAIAMLRAGGVLDLFLDGIRFAAGPDRKQWRAKWSPVDYAPHLWRQLNERLLDFCPLSAGNGNGPGLFAAARQNGSR